MRYLLVLLFCASTSLAAPVPKPREDTGQHLIGIWKYDWDEMKGGFICFYSNGTYYAKHYPDQPDHWYGEWFVADGVYHIREHSVNDRNGMSGGWNGDRRFKIDMSNYPLRVTMKEPWCSLIVLTEKIEFGED